MDHSGPVRVDGLTILGAFHGIGHAKCAAIERVFLSQHLWYPEHNCAVHVRWSFVLEHIPAMRSRHLYEDLSDVYREAMTWRSGYPLLAAYDMSMLQERLWRVLNGNGLTMTHAYGWELCAAQSWQRQLLTRMEEQRPWRRNTFGKIKKPRIVAVPETPNRKWYH